MKQYLYNRLYDTAFIYNDYTYNYLDNKKIHMLIDSYGKGELNIDIYEFKDTNFDFNSIIFIIINHENIRKMLSVKFNNFKQTFNFNQVNEPSTISLNFSINSIEIEQDSNL